VVSGVNGPPELEPYCRPIRRPPAFPLSSFTQKRTAPVPLRPSRRFSISRLLPRLLAPAPAPAPARDSRLLPSPWVSSPTGSPAMRIPSSSSRFRCSVHQYCYTTLLAVFCDFFRFLFRETLLLVLDERTLRIGKESLEAGDHIYSWRAAWVYAHHGAKTFLCSSPSLLSLNFDCWIIRSD
jgi:hypothetical protein